MPRGVGVHTVGIGGVGQDGRERASRCDSTKKQTNRASHQPQTGIGRSTPAHTGRGWVLAGLHLLLCQTQEYFVPAVIDPCCG